MPGVLTVHWELILPEGGMGGSLPPCGIRLSRDNLEACHYCSTLRAKLHELMPARFFFGGGSSPPGCGVPEADTAPTPWALLESVTGTRQP